MSTAPLNNSLTDVFEPWRKLSQKQSLIARSRRLRARVEETESYVAGVGDCQVRRAIWRCICDASALIDTAEKLVEQHIPVESGD